MKTSNHITLENMNQAMFYNRWCMDKFKSYVHGNILEVGCGIGNFTEALTNHGKVWAMDIDNHCVAETKKRIGKNARVGFGNIESGKYFFPKRNFDSIICLNVLEHIDHDEKALAHMFTLLHPGGHLILLVPIHQFLYGTIDKSIHHFRRYDPQSLLLRLKGKNFSVVEHQTMNIMGAIGWWFAGKIFRSETVGNKQIKMFNFVSPFVLPLEDIVHPPFGTSILVVARK